MRIINNTKKRVITETCHQCLSMWQKAAGLMFSKQKDILFIEDKEKKIPLHMYFVFYPIDVLYLNKKKRVTEIKEYFQPFTFYNPKNKAQYVLELKAGTVKRTKTEITDLLEFQ